MPFKVKNKHAKSGTVPALAKDELTPISWGGSAPPDPPISRPGGLRDYKYASKFGIQNGTRNPFQKDIKYVPDMVSYLVSDLVPYLVLII